MQTPTIDERAGGAAPSAPESQTQASAGTVQGAWRMARRIGVAIVGSIVLGVGLVLLVTPGPAFVVIPIGLGILSLEFDWARRWLHKVKERIGAVLPHRHGERGQAGSRGRTSAR